MTTANETEISVNALVEEVARLKQEIGTHKETYKNTVLALTSELQLAYTQIRALERKVQFDCPEIAGA